MEEKKKLRIGLAGNPNTGKSTVFNALTGLKQHTGNWSGKTVGCAVGNFSYGNTEAELVDLPGIYSLFSDSAEERCAKEFILYGNADVILVILDAVCLERNLPLALQTAQMHPRVVFCLNLMDEAKKKGITIDTKKLEEMTGVPVVPTAARDGKGIETLKAQLLQTAQAPPRETKTILQENYPSVYAYLQESCKEIPSVGIPKEMLYQLILEGDENFYKKLLQIGKSETEVLEWMYRNESAQQLLQAEGENMDSFCKKRSLFFLQEAKTISQAVCKKTKGDRDTLTERIDGFVLHGKTGALLMLGLLALVFWITVAGANVPSDLLMQGFQHLGDSLRQGLMAMHVPQWIESLLMDGVYLTVSWVVAVMLPPMAIFFPLFTLLEDFGLLPRIAFQLDGLFQKAGAHGKQALTLCMGFGCNAAGVTSCRIIDSPRERLIAILTNNFVPCNGRFPTIILLAGLFLSAGSPWLSGFAVCVVVALSVGITLLISSFLSKTALKGVPSSFVLELPPYRKPKIGQVLVRSLLDRTIFVLGRAVTVAIPAGAVIWLCGNIEICGADLMTHIATFLQPLGSLMGLSGVILTAFLLGMPANEIVIPILLMFYSQSGMLTEAEGMIQAGQMLAANGWTWTTAVCAILFTLNHFPCATTLLTIRKETGSRLWTAVSFLLPTVVGILLCILLHGLFTLLGL